MLADSEILKQKKIGNIKIVPFKKKQLGSNSYDCRLGRNLAVYLPKSPEDEKFFKKIVTNKLNPYVDEKTYLRFVRVVNSITLDAKEHNQVFHFIIPKKGIILYPAIGYLGVTEEYTETHNLVPFIEGKSSSGRLFIGIHETAGKGDAGFCGYWTLEISVKHNVVVYHKMPIAQLIYYPLEGEIINPYNKKVTAKYSGQGGRPVESMMWKNNF